MSWIGCRGPTDLVALKATAMDFAGANSAGAAYISFVRRLRGFCISLDGFAHYLLVCIFAEDMTDKRRMLEWRNNILFSVNWLTNLRLRHRVTET
jgi:hypothetical protein